MSEPAFAVLLLLVLAWAVTSRLLARSNITGAIVFAVSGYVLANPSWGPLLVDVETPSVHLLAELTLALLLFSDAARVNVSQLRRDIGFPARLLGIGLPLSIVLGSLLAALLFDDLSWALAGFVGATLAPTDAALSAQVINDGRIPLRLRRALNVESGLNDGIATPVVVFMLAVAASQLGTTGHGEPGSGGALVDLALGVVVGIVVGAGSARMIAMASRRQWIIPGVGAWRRWPRPSPASPLPWPWTATASSPPSLPASRSEPRFPRTSPTWRRSASCRSWWAR